MQENGSAEHPDSTATSVRPTGLERRNTCLIRQQGYTAAEEGKRFSTKGYAVARARKTAISRSIEVALESYEAVKGCVLLVNDLYINQMGGKSVRSLRRNCRATNCFRKGISLWRESGFTHLAQQCFYEYRSIYFYKVR